MLLGILHQGAPHRAAGQHVCAAHCPQLSPAPQCSTEVSLNCSPSLHAAWCSACPCDGLAQPTDCPQGLPDTSAAMSSAQVMPACMLSRMLHCLASLI